MSRAPLILCLLFCAQTSACHVVEKNKRCTALAEVLHEARPQIKAKLQNDPSSASLINRSQTYTALSQRVKQLPFESKELKGEHKKLVHEFDKIAKELKNAAAAREQLENSAKVKQDQTPPDAPTTAPPSKSKGGNKGKKPHAKAARKKRDSKVTHAKRRYAQAKKAIDQANQSLESIAKRITKNCR